MAACPQSSEKVDLHVTVAMKRILINFDMQYLLNFMSERYHYHWWSAVHLKCSNRRTDETP
jgi:hypothetical protein